jgi:hypothetical protein
MPWKRYAPKTQLIFSVLNYNLVIQNREAILFVGAAFACIPLSFARDSRDQPFRADSSIAAESPAGLTAYTTFR